MVSAEIVVYRTGSVHTRGTPVLTQPDSCTRRHVHHSRCTRVPQAGLDRVSAVDARSEVCSRKVEQQHEL